MPIYEFRCVKCGYKFETITIVDEDGSGLTCPDCAAPCPEKLISLFSATGLEPKASGSGGCDSSSGFS